MLLSGTKLSKFWPSMQTARRAPKMKGAAMKKETSRRLEAEDAFAKELYRNRASLNQQAQQVLAAGTRQITIRLSNSEIALARQQAEAKGLKYQTYIKMLLHEALAARTA
jgi:predicted DNA binding CopG/RHH family protein